MDLQIYNAVEANHPEVLRELLESGGNVNEFYHDMTLISAKSILHMCCEKGREECVKVLLEKDADLTIQDTWYQTPLMYCMLTQYHEIADIMLEHDPSIVDIGDRYGKTALHIAVETGAIDCIEVLLKHDADVNVTTNFGVTPLITVCGSKEIPPDDVVKIVRMLIEHGADCNMKCYRNRRTALQMAMLTKNIEVIELLLGAGSDPSTMDKSGRCPITNLLWYHRGIDSKGDLDDDIMMIIIMLVQVGADLNLTRYEHSNALCMAALCRCTNLVAYMLDSGAKQDVKFYCGTTPLQIACKNRDLPTMKVLLKYRSNLYRKGRVIRGQLDYNADVFHLAMDIGAFDAAILLARCGYNITRVRYLRDWTQTPPEALLDNQLMLDMFRHWASVVPTLYNLALWLIRKQLNVDNFSTGAEMLPLPRSLKDAVSMKTELT